MFCFISLLRRTKWCNNPTAPQTAASEIEPRTLKTRTKCCSAVRTTMTHISWRDGCTILPLRCTGEAEKRRVKLLKNEAFNEEGRAFIFIKPQEHPRRVLNGNSDRKSDFLFTRKRLHRAPFLRIHCSAVTWDCISLNTVHLITRQLSLLLASSVPVLLLKCRHLH